MSNTRITLYREAIDLESKRAALQAEIDQVASRLSNIHSQLRTGAEPVSRQPSTPTAKETQAPSASTAPTRRRRGRAGRGELKSAVLQALSAAGNAGLRVKDLANTLGSKAANIYAWFQNATKTNRQIKKIGEAHYRLEESLPESAPAAPAPKAGRAGRRKSTRPKGKRGELAARIVEGLQGAGKQGIKLRDLAAQLDVNPKNLSVWFATTGKKNKAIRKIGEGQYRLES